MDIQSLYQRWYDDRITDDFYSDKPQLVSFDAFRDDLLADVDSLYNEGINPHSLTAAAIDSDDDFDVYPYSADEYVFILQHFLAS